MTEEITKTFCRVCGHEMKVVKAKCCSSNILICTYYSGCDNTEQIDYEVK